MFKKTMALLAIMSIVLGFFVIPANAAVGDNETYKGSAWDIHWDFSDFTATDGSVPVSSDTITNTHSWWTLGGVSTSDTARPVTRVSPYAAGGDHGTAMLIETSNLAASAADPWAAGAQPTVMSGANLQMTTNHFDCRNGRQLVVEYSFLLPQGWQGATPYSTKGFYVCVGQNSFDNNRRSQFFVRENGIGWFGLGDDRTGMISPKSPVKKGDPGAILVNLEIDHWYRMVYYMDFPAVWNLRDPQDSSKRIQDEPCGRAILFDDVTGEIIAEEFLNTSDLQNFSGNIYKYWASYGAFLGGDVDSNGISFNLGAKSKVVIDDIKLAVPKITSLAGEPMLGYKEGYSAYAKTAQPVINGGPVWNHIADKVGQTVTVPVRLSTSVTNSSGAEFNSIGYSDRPAYYALALYEDNKMIDVDIKKFDGFAKNSQYYQVHKDTLSIDIPATLAEGKTYMLKKIVMDDEFQPICEPEIVY